jgi:membrane protease YdiL (CAAX protease family)
MNYPGLPSLPAGTAPEVLSILIVSLTANPCEEIGWRGFALPRLQNIYNPFIASLVIGCLSGLWHLPFFYWNESPMAAYPFLPWFAGTVCTSFIATWLYNNATGSLLVVSAFHIFLNTFSVLVGIGSFYIYAIVSALFVALILASSGHHFFTTGGLSGILHRNE